jgi:hypothetical protein
MVCNKESVSRVMKARHLARRGGGRETAGKRNVGSPRLRWEENKLDLKGIVHLKARSKLNWLR